MNSNSYFNADLRVVQLCLMGYSNRFEVYSVIIFLIQFDMGDLLLLNKKVKESVFDGL